MDHLLLRASGCSKPGNSRDTARDILMLNGEAVTSQQGRDISISIHLVSFCAMQIVVGEKASREQAHPQKTACPPKSKFVHLTR